MGAIPKLTDLEITIMKVIWDEKDGITIQGIAERLSDRKISVPSVAQAIKHLLEKDAVYVQNFVKVANVYARRFGACFDQEDFLAAEFHRLQTVVFEEQPLHTGGIASKFLGNAAREEMTAEDMDELTKILEEKKKKLEQK